jgi:hypothetical protein
MRDLILFTSVTLDGFMAVPDNDLGFMVPDDELDETITGELMPKGDSIVVGRNPSTSWPPTDRPKPASSRNG